MILCADPRANYLAHRTEIDEAIAGVLEGGRYVLGEQVRSFEEEFARYLGVRHAVGVGSGTEALHVALRACGVGPGDEVITVAHTAVATVAAIELTGATPILVDIEPRWYGLDPARLERAVGPRTRAIVPVHLYGHPADLVPVLAVARAHGIRVIEDCAQAHGALYDGRRVGSLGDMSAFSFYPTKNLGALGDGGCVATDDEELGERARLLRQYGWRERDRSQLAGWNTRLDEIQAAVLRVKLRHLDADNAARARLAARYHDSLRETAVSLPTSRAGSTHVFHLYVVRSVQRDRLVAGLARAGIQALVHYPVPVHLQHAYAGRLAAPGDLQRSEEAAQEVLSLPLFPELGETGVDAVAEAVIGLSGR